MPPLAAPALVIALLSCSGQEPPVAVMHFASVQNRLDQYGPMRSPGGLRELELEDGRVVRAAENQLILRLRSDLDNEALNSLESAIETAGGVVIGAKPEALLLQVRVDDVLAARSTLQIHPAVVWAEPNTVADTEKPSFPKLPWHQND